MLRGTAFVEVHIYEKTKNVSCPIIADRDQIMRLSIGTNAIARAAATP